MIVTIIAFFYISFLCQAYGLMLFKLLDKISGTNQALRQPMIITCFSGLALVGLLATTLSLFLPMANPAVQLFFVLPALIWSFQNYGKTKVLMYFKTLRHHFTTSTFLLLAICIALVLIMHAWFIIHPDTLIYHAQNIQWSAQYPAVPGIVNLQSHFGFQSSWFVIGALFGFSIPGVDALTFINATVLIWFFIFIVQKISHYLKTSDGQNILPGLMWLLLLLISFASYTQVRLTATSASPDFIVVLYLWLIIYLFFKTGQGQHPAFILLTVFLGFFAVTIKLSALPVILFPLYAFYKMYPNRRVFARMLLAIFGLVILTPLLARNVISSGYIAYPASFPNLFSPDWKAPKELADITREYITAYARTNVEYNPDAIRLVSRMSLTEWVPQWWSLRSVTDKFILVAVAISTLMLIAFAKKLIGTKNRLIVPGAVFLLAGNLIWFFGAPDPRFGFGFLIPTIGLLLFFIMAPAKRMAIHARRLLNYGVYGLAIVLAIYTGYRLSNYFTWKNILLPSGISTVPYRTVNCNGLSVNFPLNNARCGDAPLPCTQDGGCGNFVPRGAEITDGFKPSP